MSKSNMSKSDNPLYEYIDPNPRVQPTDEELEEFRGRVSEWMKLDEQIKKLQVAVKERRTHQRALSNGIQSFMIIHGYDNLQTQKGKILSNVRQVKQPLKLGDIRDRIINNGHLSGQELLEKIFEDDRPLVEKKSLRRVMPKISMHLEI